MRSLKQLVTTSYMVLLYFFLIIDLVTIAALVLNDNKTLGELKGICYFLIVLSTFTIIFCVIRLVITYNKAKTILQNISGFDKLRFEREIKAAPQIKNILLSSDAICFFTQYFQIVPINRIVWAYPQVNGKNHFLTIYLDDITRFDIPITVDKKIGSPDMAVNYILRLIVRKSPAVFIGYEEKYQTLFRIDFQEMTTTVKATPLVDSNTLELEYRTNNYYVKDFH